MKWINCFLIFVLMMAACPVSADIILWSGYSSPDWGDDINWNGYDFPSSSDSAEIRTGNSIWPVISTGTYTIAELRTHGATQSGSVNITMTGGTLNCTNIKLISYGTSSDIDSMLITGGTINSSGKVYLSYDTDSYTVLKMTGGTLNTTQLVLPGTTSSGAEATFMLYGGNLRAGSLYFRSASPNAVLDIANSGKLTLDGDQRSAVTSAFNAGRIISYAGAGNLSVNYGVTESGKTTVTATCSDTPAVIQWDGDTSTDWFTGGNWNGGSLPTIIDDAEFNAGATYWPTITAGEYINIDDLRTHSTTGSGSVNVNMTGGTLNCTDIKLIGRGGSSDTDTFDMDGGTINSSGKIYLNWDSDSDVIFDMSGGVVTTSELVIPGTENTGIDATFKLHGGNLRITSFVFRDGSPNATLDIYDDGILTLDGNQISNVKSAFEDGDITAYGGSGELLYDYGVTESGKTTVVAVPDQSVVPLDIYVYDLAGAYSSDSECTMMASLAGVINQKSPEVVLGGDDWSYCYRPEFWADRIGDICDVNVTLYADPNWFISHYSDDIKGYILYDSDSINPATSLAGLYQAIIVDSSTQNYATNAGLPLLVDARSMTDTDVYSAYGSSFNKEIVFNVGTDKKYEARDHAVSNRAYICYDPTNFNTVLSNQTDNSLVLGFGSNEYNFFDDASDNSLSIVAGSCISLSAFEKWGIDCNQQQTHTSPDVNTESDVHYVAFVLSDGDNLAFVLKSFLSNTKFFASTYRGDFNMNWDMTPAIADLNPLAMNYIYQQASTGTYKDFFVSAGGEGICFPSEYPDEDGYANTTAAAMEKADHTVISILDDSYDSSVMGKLLAKSQVMGAMYKTYNNSYKGLNGAIYWHSGKPVVTVKYSLWDGVDSPSEIISALNSASTSPTTSQSSYSIVNVHPWSTSTGPGYGAMQNVNYIVDNLDSDVRVVTLDELIIHLRANFGTPVE